MRNLKKKIQIKNLNSSKTVECNHFLCENDNFDKHGNVFCTHVHVNIACASFAFAFFPHIKAIFIYHDQKINDPLEIIWISIKELDRIWWISGRIHPTPCLSGSDFYNLDGWNFCYFIYLLLLLLLIFAQEIEAIEMFQLGGNNIFLPWVMGWWL